MTAAVGAIRKMRTELASPVNYSFVAGDSLLPLKDAIGLPISIVFTGVINCVHCNRVTKKSFNQGYCYPCFRKLAQCDSCIVSPEKCHFDAGTCREPEWGEANCNIEHIVYLANTSGIKVGITRGTQVPTRWIDQGATQALPIARVATRKQSGLLEVAIGQHVSDKTAWQRMLKGNQDDLDLGAIRDELIGQCERELRTLQSDFGLQSIQIIDNAEVQQIAYPVLEWPVKVKAHNLDKQPEVFGTLLGIKGQYLMLDTGVINIRKYGGYNVEFKVGSV
ncbi:conserved hypothetical protein [Luminiphilus syltensis NOR5-1B]|uniref:DUF2797 domain-containing protein n=1 Tax=Luminiphilus syltensis NOR5-1B TaxID=565045 RepID=B8KXW4_9GAMM|nr:DUF2797 domain-containing protein [Luminiphilus syltensis]EED36745.1 conserved hypothetical protein [Luminiphilus syltensis NOR5-1B]